MCKARLTACVRKASRIYCALSEGDRELALVRSGYSQESFEEPFIANDRDKQADQYR